MSEINTGDVLFQIMMLLGLIVPVVLIWIGVKGWKRRSSQLERIEKKLDDRS
ncbi:hypothetical protein [Domibacillus enclensis]|uniref:Uncharacterized protein n=1 Tax=Domibacillus enclensis TaxID=1017273 RepID=A0A1N6XQH5_9BACI|nr:hypothetical protein [Domibacillus enclensis]SIR04573.1 hypothetical protein SAMN05443094_10524 [Domibacillus enclensis]